MQADVTAAPRRASPGLVSVVIPAYNAARHLRAAIESVLVQTYSPIEIIVVDDGSIDETPEILQAFGSGVTVIRQDNRGLSTARNVGIRASSGEFLAFLDADDLWRPDKLMRQVATLGERPECAMVHTSRTVIDAAGLPLDLNQAGGPVLDGECLVPLIVHNAVAVSSVLVRRAALGDGPVFDADVQGTGDWDLWLRLASRGPLAFIPEPLVCYRWHESNMSHNSALMIRDSLLTIEKFIERGERPDALAVARQQRHDILLMLGHHAFESGSYREARQRFRQAGAPWRRPEIIRFAAACMPAVLRDPLQKLYRRLRGDEDESHSAAPTGGRATRNTPGR